MDTIASTWTAPQRIGLSTPTYEAEHYAAIEEKILSLCSRYGLTGKFNVGLKTGGIPPIGDKTPIVNPTVSEMAYYDVLGGIMVATRNAEVNCRLIDYIQAQPDADDGLALRLLDSIRDKYVLPDEPQSQYSHVVFLPGSNLLHSVNHERVHEILLDFPNAVVKPHPIQTEPGLARLYELYGEKLISKDISGIDVLQRCSMLWTTYNSEMGLIAALRQQQFGHITSWNKAFLCVFSGIYRHMKYRNTIHNYAVMQKLITSPISGFVFPWQTDWEDRLEQYFAAISKPLAVGAEYPYRSLV